MKFNLRNIKTVVSCRNFNFINLGPSFRYIHILIIIYFYKGPRYTFHFKSIGFFSNFLEKESLFLYSCFIYSFLKLASSVTPPLLADTSGKVEFGGNVREKFWYERREMWYGGRGILIASPSPSLPLPSPWDVLHQGALNELAVLCFYVFPCKSGKRILERERDSFKCRRNGDRDNLKNKLVCGR